MGICGIALIRLCEIGFYFKLYPKTKWGVGIPIFSYLSLRNSMLRTKYDIIKN
jgi:hypothetical protein